MSGTGSECVDPATVGRLGPEEVMQELGETLEEATMTLVERAAQWPKQW